MADWQSFKSAPKDGREIAVVSNLDMRALHRKRSGAPFKWDKKHERWLQKSGGQWHEPFFEPTYWRERVELRPYRSQRP